MGPKSMNTLPSDYLKFSQNVIDCKSENRCRIYNEERVAHLLHTYLNNLQEEGLVAADRIDGAQKLFQKPSCKEDHDSVSNLSELTSESSSSALVPSSNVREQEKKFKMMNTLNTTTTGPLRDTNFRIGNTDTREKKSPNNKKLATEKCSKSKKETITEADSVNTDYVISAERPHRCPSCKMAFKRKMHLKRHFLVAHSKKKSHVCKICGKLFSRKDYLDKHDAGHLKRNFKLQLLKEGVVVRTKMHTKKTLPSCPTRRFSFVE